MDPFIHRFHVEVECQDVIMVQQLFCCTEAAAKQTELMQLLSLDWI